MNLYAFLKKDEICLRVAAEVVETYTNEGYVEVDPFEWDRQIINGATKAPEVIIEGEEAVETAETAPEAPAEPAA